MRPAPSARRLRCARSPRARRRVRFPGAPDRHRHLFPRTRRFLRGAGCCAACIDALGVAHRHAERDDLGRGSGLLRGWQTQQGARVAHVELARRADSPAPAWQAESAAADWSPRCASVPRPAQRPRASVRIRRSGAGCPCASSSGIQVLALDVLDQRQRQRRLVGNFAHQRRHFAPGRRAAPRASAVRRR